MIMEYRNEELYLTVEVMDGWEYSFEMAKEFVYLGFKIEEYGTKYREIKASKTKLEIWNLESTKENQRKLI